MNVFAFSETVERAVELGHHEFPCFELVHFQ